MPCGGTAMQTGESPYRIEPLNARHLRATFACGKPPLDEFLHKLAGQYEKRNIGRTFVAVAGSDPEVLGYFTLVAASVPFGDMPQEVAKKLPEHPVPAVLLARLAVTTRVRGQKLGALLLTDAFARVLRVGELVAWYALLVHAIDEDAAAFYEHFGFKRFPHLPSNLYLPFGTIAKSVALEG